MQSLSVNHRQVCMLCILCNAHCSVDEDTGQATVSTLFKWYRLDFGGTDRDVLLWIQQHATDEIVRVSALEHIIYDLMP
jgi:hypothetical protein